jgi:hypothetical protein
MEPPEQPPRDSRGSCEKALEPEAGVAAVVEAARIVAEEWKRCAPDISSPPMSDALGCVLAALDGAPGVNVSRELAIGAARYRARNIVRRKGSAERIRLEVEE